MMRFEIKGTGIAQGFCLTLSLLAPPSWAGPVEDSIRRAIEPRLGMPAARILKSPYAGLYEVDTPRGLIYTDAKGSFVMFGGVFVDTKTGNNLSEMREAQLSAFKFSELPLADAIKTVYGNGKRVLVTIEDPNCGYCKRLVSELQKLDNVTVYTFLYPLLGEDSVQKSKAVWCSNDRSKTWHAFMSNGNAALAGTSCPTPIKRNLALGEKLRVKGTPVILFESGHRIPGFATAEQIAQKLGTPK